MITIEQALEIALNAHRGQKDLDGKPVILHPLSVGLQGDTEAEVVTGFLHDVVEDTDYTFDTLKEKGVSEEILSALELLTHKEGQVYQDYLKRIINSHNQIALKVKIRDLMHNIRRNDRSTEEKRRIYRKHLNAIRLLRGGK